MAYGKSHVFAIGERAIDCCLVCCYNSWKVNVLSSRTPFATAVMLPCARSWAVTLNMTWQVQQKMFRTDLLLTMHVLRRPKN